MKKVFRVLAVFLLIQPYFIFSQEPPQPAAQPTQPDNPAGDNKDGEDEKIAGSYLTGDWAGIRQNLVDKGIALEFVLTNETVYNDRGGIAKGYVTLGNLDTTADIDFEKLAGISGLQLFLYGLGGYGMAPTELVGDVQATSNIETGMDYYKLYEAWVQYSLLDDMIAVLAGLHDLNSEFYANDPAGLFLNSSMGIGTEIAQTGENGPSIFPIAAPAVRLMVKPTDTVYVSAAAYNALAGDPATPAKTAADFKFENGFLTIAEAGIYSEGDYKFALGGWMYTDKVDGNKNDGAKVDADGNPIKIQETGYGAYLLADKTFGDISVFFRAGMANPEAFEFSYNIMEGITISGNLWGRPDDALGIGASTIITSTVHKSEEKAAGTNLDPHETSIEVTYLIQATPWVSIQPDFQYVLNPGVDPELKDTLASALRVSLSF